ncbi:protein N-terminal asparagine amidohydrolase [Tanacetum coccineum]
MLPMIISIRIPHMLHLEGKLFESLGCLVLVCRDCIGSSKFSIYEMRKECYVWSSKYIVNTDDFMNPLPEGWSIQSITLREIYDMESNEIADDYLHGFISPYAMYDVGYKKLDYKIRSLDSPTGLFVNHIRSSFDCDFVSLDPKINSRKYTIENPFTLGSTEEADKVKILQSCNGLLLCTGSWRHAFDYVYNPSTNLFKILPEPDYANDDSNFYGCAGLRLAFDPTKSPYYKVVRAGRTCSDIFIQIYCSEKGNWSLYHVDTDDFMTPLPEGWSIWSTVWSVVLGEMGDDSFLVINLSGKVVEYNLISKNLRDMYDMRSNQVTDDYHDGFIPPFAMNDMRPKQLDHKFLSDSSSSSVDQQQISKDKPSSDNPNAIIALNANAHTICLLRYLFNAIYKTQGGDMVTTLLEHPDLVSASRSFCAITERKFSVPEESGSQSSVQAKCVYVFQKEYAIADPALVEIIGTDEATTCVGIVIRNSRSGMTSCAHLDSPDVVDIGLSQMLSLVSDSDDNAILDVHLVGAFDDSAPQVWEGDDDGSELYSEMDGYSTPLCIKIVEKLAESKLKFQIQNFQVLKHNTRWDSDGNAYPIFHGLLVETSSGSVVPASFDRSTRCPDEIIRRIRLGASFEDPKLAGRLLDTYETQADSFVITPFSWSMGQVHIASVMRHRSDLEILLTTSTSPTAEGPDFVDNQKRIWEYLIQHPDWKEAFPSKVPRVFKRTGGTNWEMSSE